MNLGDNQIEDQHVADDSRDIRGLRNANDQRLHPGERIVVNENGMRGFETNTCIVEHVHGHAGDGEVFLRGKESVDLNIPRHRGVKTVDEQLHVLAVKAVGDDGHLGVAWLPLRHFQIDFVGWHARQHPEVVDHLDFTCWK